MIVEDYPPLPGGDGVYVREIGHILAKKGFQIHVITRGRSKGVKKELPKYTVHRVSKFTGRSFSRRLQLASKFATCALKLDKQEKFDLIHAQGNLPAVAASVCSKLHGTPVVLTIHGTWPTQLLKMTSRWGEALGALEKFILTKRKYAAIIAVDSYSFSVAKKNRLTKKIFQIPNGVNLKQFQRKANEKRFCKLLKIAPRKMAGVKRILFVGRLIPQKAPENLLKTFAGVSKKVNSVLILVGSGELKKDIEKEIKRHSLEDKVFILSGPSDEDLINFYLRSDVFVLPSRWEGFPLVVVEAMACGKPIVATNVGGVPDVVDEKVGILVKVGNVPALEKALLKLLTDKKLYAKLSKNCKNRSKKYDWSAITDQTIKVYRSVHRNHTKR